MFKRCSRCTFLDCSFIPMHKLYYVPMHIPVLRSYAHTCITFPRTYCTTFPCTYLYYTAWTWIASSTQSMSTSRAALSEYQYVNVSRECG